MEKKNLGKNKKKKIHICLIYVDLLNVFLLYIIYESLFMWKIIQIL